MFDVIPDTHGQAHKLHALLSRLGWRQSTAGWVNDEPGRQIVFLGDFIDRGAENAAVIQTVRSLMDAGKARAVMGNHELNAIHFHTKTGSASGSYLREHSSKNIRQHATFLREYPLGSREANDAIRWMKGLPLFLEIDGFRAVHACWSNSHVQRVRSEAPDGVLSSEQLERAADPRDALFGATEVLTKGPEAELPKGYFFYDKDGTERRSVRTRWWKAGAQSWSEVALSVPDPGQLPTERLPLDLAESGYGANQPQVFFGHYWLTGQVVRQAANALCLDYSAGKDGPLIAYRLEDPMGEIDLARIVGHD